MELALSIALIAGIFLLILGFLIVVWAGFKHHFITGIIALIPALNFIILPSVWHRAYIGFYLSIIGVLITLGAWYGGGDTYIANQARAVGISLPFMTPTAQVVSTDMTLEKNTPLTPPQGNSQVLQVSIEPVKTALPKTGKQATFIPTGDIVSLPQQALYEIVFQVVSIDSIASLKGEHIRIEQKNGKSLEGKITRSTRSSLFLDLVEHQEGSGNIAFEIQTDSISKLEKLVRRDN